MTNAATQDDRIEQYLSTNYRPDLRIYGPGPVFKRPPFLCIEVLSPDNRMKQISERVDDYLRFGVPSVWVIDPDTRSGYVYRLHGEYGAKREVPDTEPPAIAMPLAEIFAGLGV